MNGVVVRLITDKGFGFIRGEDGREYFFHSSSLITASFNELYLDDKVTFRGSKGEKGFRAEDVEINRNG